MVPFQNLSEDSQGADTDQSLNGSLHIFDPSSSSTFVKHFYTHTVTSKNVMVKFIVLMVMFLDILI